MPHMIDVYHVENATAELSKINALVTLLRESIEPHANENGPYKHDFELLTLNLLNLFDLVYQLRADLNKVVDTVYTTTAEH